MKTNSLLFKLLLLVIIISSSFITSLKAQSPDKMSYQSVIRNASGLLLANQNVGIKISVLQGTASGTAVYTETHSVTTNTNGLVSLEIGSGTAVIGTFSAIDWTDGPYFLQTEIDPTGGSSYTISSANQFLSVPYAKYADVAGSTTGAAGGDLGGTYPNPSVVKIQSLPVSTILPTSNEALIWNGTHWSPGPTVTGLASGDLGDSYPNPTVVKIQNRAVSSAAPASSQALVWDGTQWAPGATVTGAAGGDLGGTYPNPSVVKLQSSPVSATVPAAGDALVWNGTEWAPATSSGLGTNFWTLNGTGDIYNNNVSGNVGVGTNTATYRLDVLHNGSTGVRVRSDNGFSTVDIDAASGDAALRFANAGVNQWNMRNRPGDNYLEIFELGGGGSRVVIQDATGNVGIGETVAPIYKLDVLHNGSTGIRSCSDNSFSVVDIDGASGDAALRFANAGVNQWNLRNRPGDNYLEIFELGGGGSRVVIQDGTGNVGIGETVSPAYKLDVLHGGSTGLRVRSSSSFSVVDIDGESGDAALRFAKAGVNQWNIRNRPADDYLEIFELGGGGSRFVIQDGTGNVGIGETVSPSYKLDVLHSGSTGIRSRSSASFSVVDIDAESGDAALRFAKAGVNQWNIRNRPADDYLEIFELGGGGSRVVVQDGTGNVGIGETVSPSYKLDVLHGGSTGIRSRSSASFSVVDIDAESGDAALRLARAGVNQWNIRNRPADDYLEIFELGGGGSRFVIQDGTGNVGIGETVSPSYKLDVLHGGATGLRVRSSSTFSIIDIDGENGDAALRFVKAGVNQWNIRNNPATDDLQVFELGGGGERMRIENATGKVVVSGDFTALGVKAFTMDHPLDPENKILMHAAAESNEVINFYSGNVVTDADGHATVKLPDYFEAINTDFRYQLTVVGVFAQAIISKEVSNNSFEIATNQPNVKVSWEVKGVRNDAHMRKFPFVAEEEKSASQKGKYMDPAAYNLPQNRGVSYDANGTGPSSLDYTAPVDKKAIPSTTGGSLDQVVLPKAKELPAETVGSTIDLATPSTVKKAAPATTGGSLDQMPLPVDKKAPVDKTGSVSDETLPAKSKVVNPNATPSGNSSIDNK
jgi:hypothetical protein